MRIFQRQILKLVESTSIGTLHIHIEYCDSDKKCQDLPVELAQNRNL